jgi:hypothetical protein
MNYDPEAFNRALSTLFKVASDIRDEDVPAALAATRIFESFLMARDTLAPRTVSPASSTPDALPPSTDDVPLKAEEAAALLGVKKQWLYRNAHKLPFAMRVSRKQLRFWRAGALRWAAKRRPGSRDAT